MKYLIAFIGIVSVEISIQRCVVSAWSQGGSSISGKRATSQQRQHYRRVEDHFQLLPATSSLFSFSQNDDKDDIAINSNNGELERLKKEEQRLSSLLDSIRQQKLAVLRSRPLSIGIVGFGRFGQFIASSFTKYGHVVATSRTDYTDVASEMGVKYVSTLEAFVLEEHLDVIVLATSIVSFKDTVLDLVPLLEKKMKINGGESSYPLIVDVASVKEHPRYILLDLLPEECDILCTHPSKSFLVKLLVYNRFILIFMLTTQPFRYSVRTRLCQERLERTNICLRKDEDKQSNS